MRRHPDPLTLWRLWKAGTAPEAICEELSISFHRLRQLAERFNLSGRERRLVVREPEPTEEEIAERALRIRSRWSPAKAARRRFGVRQARALAIRLGRGRVLE